MSLPLPRCAFALLPSALVRAAGGTRVPAAERPAA